MNKTLRTLLVLLMFVAAFWISERFHARVDLTEDKLYTLNPATVNLLENLDRKVRVEMYFSEDLPTRFQPVFQFLKALMDEYEAYGGDQFEVVYIDPKARVDEVDAAHKLGIYEVKANVTEKSRVEMTYIWFGLAMFCEDRKEIFPSVASVENFEYDITAAMIRLTREKEPEMVLAGPTYAGQSRMLFDINAHMKGIYKELAQLCEVNQVRIAPEAELDLYTADLVFAWGLHQYTEQQLYALDQYLLSGRPLILFASGVRTDPLTLKAIPAPQTADAFYAHYGFQVERNLVCDQRCTQVKYTQTKPPVLKDYPLFPHLRDQSLTRDREPLASLSNLVVPWSSVVRAAPGEGLTSQVLARTSKNAWLQENAFELDPDRAPGPHYFETYPLAHEITGETTSFFQDPGHGLHRASGQIQLQVWGSEHLLTQTQNSSIPAWAAQTTSYWVMGSKLEGVNRRENAFRPMDEMTYQEKQRIKWISVTAAPLVILLLAAVRALVRKRRDVSAYL